MKSSGKQTAGAAHKVAPFTGAWIEIQSPVGTRNLGIVAPFTGAWIEINVDIDRDASILCRSLYGGVD